MEFFNESYLTVHWLPDVRAVLMEWKMYARSAEFRRGLEAGLSCVQKNKSTRWLADMREMGVLSQEDSTWSNTDWFPRALQAGISKMALVVPKLILSKMAVDEIMRKVPATQLTTAYFDDVQKAKEWLQK